MPLPHFGDPNYEYVRHNLFKCDLKDQLLNDCLIKINKKNLFFFLTDVKILKIINQKILKSEKFNLNLSIFNKDGELLYSIYLDGVVLLKMKNIINYDYNKNECFKLKVGYSYEKMNLIIDNKDLRTYKLNNLEK